MTMKKFYIAKARRLRGTPYSSRIESQGLTTYTTYNHMLPAKVRKKITFI